MPIDFSRLNTNAPEQLGATFDPNVIAEKQNKMSAMANQGILQQLQIGQGMQAYQQGAQAMQDEAQLRDLYKKSGNDPALMIQSLRQAGLHKQADEYAKQMMAQQQAGLEFAGKRLTAVHNVNADILTDPNNWQSIVTNAQNGGAIHPEDAAHLMASYGQMPVEQIPKYAQGHMADAKEMYDKLNQKPLQAEVKTNENGEQFQITPDGKITYLIDPTTGTRIKSQKTATQMRLEMGVAGLSPEESNALWGAVDQGKQDPNRINGRNAKILAQGFLRNPNTNAAQIHNDINSTNNTESAFAKGKQGDQTRSQNVALSHLEVLGGVIDALQNGDMPMLNAIKLKAGQWLGKTELTNFEAVKQMAMGEVDKAIIGGQNAQSDREETKRAMAAAGSPAQLKEAADKFKLLLGGQLKGLHTQWQSGMVTMDPKESHDRFMKKLDLPAQNMLNKIIQDEEAQRATQQPVQQAGVKFLGFE